MATKYKYTVTNGETPLEVIDANGALLQSTTETIAAAGTTTAIDISKYHHDIDADAGGDIFTVAAGTVGQSLLFVMKSATGIATITPIVLTGGTSVTLNAIGETVILKYVAGAWIIAGGNAYTVI